MLPKLILKDKFLLTFPYSPAAVARAKAVPGGRWKKPHWEYPATPETYRALKEEFGVVCEEAERLLQLRKLNCSGFKTTPFPHQTEALLFILEQLGFKLCLTK